MHHTLDSHRKLISSMLTPVLENLGPETLKVTDAQLAGRVTATEVIARSPIPAFTNSQMDGFAVRSSDVATASEQHPVTLPLGFTAAAGAAPVTLAAGTASPVMTGALLPAGADAVIPVEASAAGAFQGLVRIGEGSPTGSVTFTNPVTPGTFVRPVGQDLEAGAVVAPAGTKITPTLIGAMVASGLNEVQVLRQPRFLICTTGDELGTAGAAAGQIPDSNSPMLATLLRGYGAIVQTAQLPDRPSLLEAALMQFASQVDVIITIGGISAGAYEVVRQTLEPLGGSFHHVAMQPGGPQGHGLLGTTPVVCLPGNPVSAFLSLEVFIAPLLRTFAGLPEPTPRMLINRETVDSPESKHQIRRAQISGDTVKILDPGSHLLHDLARADGLVHIPVGTSTLEAGASIEVWSLDV